jgi:lysophospholipase L1-like esterase
MAAVLVVVGCGTSGVRPQAARAPGGVATYGAGEPLRYLILGDSTAVAEGGTYASGIAVETARHLAAGRRVEMVNLGVSGAQTRDVLREQVPRVGAFVPDVVLLDFGANDVTHLTPARSVERDLREIVEALVAINCRVRIVVTGSPDMSAPPRIPRLLRGAAGWRTDVLNRVFRREVARYGLTFAPVAAMTGPLFQRDKTLFSGDAFHPNDRGYGTWIVVINGALDEALARQGGHCGV